MSTAHEKVTLLIGGKAHDDWTSYEIDSDLMIPSDAWELSLGAVSGKFPAEVKAGAPMQIRIGGELVMTGRVDVLERDVEKDGRSIHLSGRDLAAPLVDCSAPILVRKQVSLKEIATLVARPLGVKSIRIANAKSLIREKINVEPGETAWEVLANAAEANGLWPWIEPDGTLVIGRPNYSAAPVATLFLNFDGKNNNVETMSRVDDVSERFSTITVLGQTHGTTRETGKHDLKAAARDTGITWPRPKIVLDHEADSTAICQSRARKLMGDSRLAGFVLNATVKGHIINALGEPGHGKLWRPGMRVRVVSDVLDVNGIYFLSARKFRKARSIGTTTGLTLKEDKVWVIEKRVQKNRSTENDLPGEIIDVTGGA